MRARGLRLARARRLAAQRERLFPSAAVAADEVAARNHVVSAATPTARGTYADDLEVCDVLPQPIRRELHQMINSFHSETVRLCWRDRGVEVTRFLLQQAELDEARAFARETGRSYVGSFQRYDGGGVYKLRRRR